MTREKRSETNFTFSIVQASGSDTFCVTRSRGRHFSLVPLI